MQHQEQLEKRKLCSRSCNVSFMNCGCSADNQYQVLCNCHIRIVDFFEKVFLTVGSFCRHYFQETVFTQAGFVNGMTSSYDRAFENLEQWTIFQEPTFSLLHTLTIYAYPKAWLWFCSIGLLIQTSIMGSNKFCLLLTILLKHTMLLYSAYIRTNVKNCEAYFRSRKFGHIPVALMRSCCAPHQAQGSFDTKGLFGIDDTEEHCSLFFERWYICWNIDDQPFFRTKLWWWECVWIRCVQIIEVQHQLILHLNYPSGARKEIIIFQPWLSKENIDLWFRLKLDKWNVPWVMQTYYHYCL